MQISRVLLAYDVKISQLGRKNLAVRFDTDQIVTAASEVHPGGDHNLGAQSYGTVIRADIDGLIALFSPSAVVRLMTNSNFKGALRANRRAFPLCRMRLSVVALRGAILMAIPSSRRRLSPA